MYRFEVYPDTATEWRWRLIASNGLLIADSGEGYSSRSNARRAARRMKVAVWKATVA